MCLRAYNAGQRRLLTTTCSSSSSTFDAAHTISMPWATTIMVADGSAEATTHVSQSGLLSQAFQQPVQEQLRPAPARRISVEKSPPPPQSSLDFSTTLGNADCSAPAVDTTFASTTPARSPRSASTLPDTTHDTMHDRGSPPQEPSHARDHSSSVAALTEPVGSRDDRGGTTHGSRMFRDSCARTPAIASASQPVDSVTEESGRPLPGQTRGVPLSDRNHRTPTQSEAPLTTEIFCRWRRRF